MVSTNEDFKDIIEGLGQRIRLYKKNMHELHKRLSKTEAEIETTKKYLELAETLYRVEVEKAKAAQGVTVSSGGEGKEDGQRDDDSIAILLESSRYSGLSVPQSAFLLLTEAGRALHAKDICQRLLDGGVRIRGKTPVTSVSTSLSRDKRFMKVAPNTFRLVGDAGDRPLQSVYTDEGG